MKTQRNVIDHRVEPLQTAMVKHREVWNPEPDQRGA